MQLRPRPICRVHRAVSGQSKRQASAVSQREPIGKRLLDKCSGKHCPRGRCKPKPRRASVRNRDQGKDVAGTAASEFLSGGDASVGFSSLLLDGSQSDIRRGKLGASGTARFERGLDDVHLRSQLGNLLLLSLDQDLLLLG